LAEKQTVVLSKKEKGKKKRLIALDSCSLVLICCVWVEIAQKINPCERKMSYVWENGAPPEHTVVTIED